MTKSKALTLTSLAFLFYSITNGQVIEIRESDDMAMDYKKFKCGIGLGRNLIHVNSSLLYLEPSYQVAPNFSVGFRVELATTIVALKSTSKAQGDLTSSFIYSYSMNGKYYRSTKKKLRPYVGLGLGLFAMYVSGGTFVYKGKNVTLNSNEQVHYANKFGLYPSLGIDWGHFNIAINYNLLPSTMIDVVTTTGGVGSTNSVKIKNSYFPIKLGFSFGGGARKSKQSDR